MVHQNNNIPEVKESLACRGEISRHLHIGYCYGSVKMVNEIKALGGDLSDEKMIEKASMSLPNKFEPKLCAIEECEKLKKLVGSTEEKVSFSEFISSLQSSEKRMSIRPPEYEEAPMKNEIAFVSHEPYDNPEDCWWRQDVRCSKCGTLGHIEKVCSDATSGWILDSGCSKHMCKDKRVFVSLKPTEKKSVRSATGHEVFVEGIGSITLKGDGGVIQIDEVLYVPALKQNLLSLGQQLRHKFTLTFSGLKCNIENPSRSSSIYSELLNNNLFSFPLSITRSTGKLDLIHTDLCGPQTFLKISKECWAEAAATAKYLLNALPSRTLGGKTSYELLL